MLIGISEIGNGGEKVDENKEQAATQEIRTRFVLEGEQEYLNGLKAVTAELEKIKQLQMEISALPCASRREDG